MRTVTISGLVISTVSRLKQKSLAFRLDLRFLHLCIFASLHLLFDYPSLPLRQCLVYSESLLLTK